MNISPLCQILLLLLIGIQISISFNNFQSAYTLETNDTSQSSSISDLEQEDAKENRTAIFNQPDGSRATAADLGLNHNTLTPELIAEDLSQKNSSQIAQFPLQEYSKNDILIVFNNLSDDALEKVITSLYPDNIRIIFDKFLPMEREPIYERLSQQIQDSIKSTLS
jgi:hypothetical protein